MTSYRLGNLTFRFGGAGDLHDALAGELSSVTAAEPIEAADLEFEFGVCPDPPEGASISTPVCSWSSGYRVQLGGLRYVVQSSSQPRKVFVEHTGLHSGPRRHIPDTLWRLYDWNHLGRTETVAKNFMYEVFDYLTQLEQLTKRQTYVHASSFERAGRGVAIFA